MKKEIAQMSASSKDNSFGVASVVLAIVSIAFASIYGIILGIVALVFAQKQKALQKNSWSKWGFILSIIGIVLSILTLIITSYYLANLDQFAALAQ